ncbi:hypothetical protein LINPERHAP2_LOCUS33470 [Linum perenne]
MLFQPTSTDVPLLELSSAAWDAGFCRVVARLELLAVLGLINLKEEPTHQHSGEIITLRRLLQRKWEVTLSHTYREGNCVSDYLASLGHNLLLGTHVVLISDCNFGHFLRTQTYS